MAATWRTAVREVAPRRIKVVRRHPRRRASMKTCLTMSHFHRQTLLDQRAPAIGRTTE